MQEGACVCGETRAVCCNSQWTSLLSKLRGQLLSYVRTRNDLSLPASCLTAVFQHRVAALPGPTGQRRRIDLPGFGARGVGVGPWAGGGRVLEVQSVGFEGQEAPNM